MRISLPCKYYSELIFRRLVRVVAETQCDCIALSGGIDSSMILLAAVSAGVKPKALTVMYRGGLPKDLPYVLHLCKVLNADLEVITVDTSDALGVWEEIIRCVGINGINSHGDGGCIEFRNDLVFYMTMRRAKELKCRCIYVGSGGDELFLGYNYLLHMLSDDIEKAINNVIHHGRFPEIEIARCLDVNVVAPYLTKDVMSLATMIPLQCLRSERMLGKEVLRDVLMMHNLEFIALRMKEPAEEGAGTKVICKSIYDK